jgi:peroxiredoxin Q/BCP
VVGISPQDVDSHDAFIAHHGLTVPLLADVDRVVARAYGVARGGVAALVQGVQRAVFIVDEDGIVRYRHVHAIGLDFQTADDLRDAIDALPARA